MLAGLAAFSGTRRRFEPKGRAAGVQVVDDYAHNPGKVAAVVETATDGRGRRAGRLVVVFQPHLYSRTRDFAGGFGAGLAAADVVVVMDVYGAREDPKPGVSGAAGGGGRARAGGAPTCATSSRGRVPEWRGCSGPATCSSPSAGRRDDDRAEVLPAGAGEVEVSGAARSGHAAGHAATLTAPGGGLGRRRVRAPAPGGRPAGCGRLGAPLAGR